MNTLETLSKKHVHYWKIVDLFIVVVVFIFGIIRHHHIQCRQNQVEMDPLSLTLSTYETSEQKSNMFRNECSTHKT